MPTDKMIQMMILCVSVWRYFVCLPMTLDLLQGPVIMCLVELPNAVAVSQNLLSVDILTAVYYARPIV